MSTPNDPKPHNRSEDPPKSHSSDGDVDPYIPPSSTTAEQSDSIPASGEKKIDYPGSIWSVLALGVLLGLVITLFLLLLLIGVRFPPTVRYLLGTVLWAGAFACVGALLAGTAKQRLLRAGVMALVSVPAFILYALVYTGAILVIGRYDFDYPITTPLISIALMSFAFVLLLITISALALRAVTRRRLRQQS